MLVLQIQLTRKKAIELTRKKAIEFDYGISFDLILELITKG